MANLYHTIHPGPGQVRVSFSGVLDEAADLTGLLDALGDEEVVLDLRGIERVNSLGLKHWITVMADLCRKVRVSVEACSPAMAQQANMVSNIFAGAEVRSCTAPYSCGRCDAEFNLLVTGDEVVAAAGDPPEKTCPSCGGPAEFDDLEIYFGFMRRRPS